ncbi:hypothetical protein GJ654_18695 [Rhodoblastus acidophilus]|uniref:Uncharacterized protein n=1 Tax=Rhodoblastus acidophilus TaxID=1074 RepID=A0A6N8DQX0_RHOAC|nr:hypothetical protein [Rhodoblastus acidophilus]MCW2276357.1 hypothetical protein [Rhodoblastus acidophilus]MTV33012.1 hypothetical protein [Rhodoblastus acidophilus]
MIPELPVRTPFDRSVHAKHVAVSGPYLGAKWGVTVEPENHPTLRDALWIRLTHEQVRFLVGAFVAMDPSLLDRAVLAVKERAWQDEIIVGHDQVLRARKSNASQSSNVEGTPNSRASTAENADLPANNCHKAEGAS